MSDQTHDMRFKPVAPRKIYQDILEQFVLLVSTGQLKAGDKIPSERELAIAFKVSRPSVREALRVLEIIGLVEIQGGGGAYLRDLQLGPFISVIAPLLFSREHFDMELLDFRELIEVKAIELLAGNLSEADLRELRESLQLMERALENNDPEAGAEADIAFHRTLVHGSRSYLLCKVLELVVALFEHAVRGGRSIVLEKHEDARQLYMDHLRIYEALQNYDFDKAKELIISHLHMVRQLYDKR